MPRIFDILLILYNISIYSIIVILFIFYISYSSLYNMQYKKILRKKKKNHILNTFYLR